MNQAVDINAAERRKNWRLKVECDVFCTTKNGRESYTALCTSLSAAGIAFICEKPFDVGDELVLQGAAVVYNYVETLTKSLGATVVRCRRLQDGRFEIGAQIIHSED